MIINDGNTKQLVNILSSKQTSAVIYLNYKPLAEVKKREVKPVYVSRPSGNAADYAARVLKK